ncbi:MAG TPA: hypothetical protein VHO66_08620 [Ruminiclostridium sp.]|nr:hypothetical protein [Ruminiclostridium sp.]
MKKFVVKAAIRALEMKNKAREVLTGKDGNVLTENGLMIAIAVALVLLILAWAYSFLNKDFLPSLGNGVKDILNFKG